MCRCSSGCSNCRYFEYLGAGEYYCSYKDTVSVDSSDDSCFGFESISGSDEIIKRIEEKEKDYDWRHNW